MRWTMIGKLALLALAILAVMAAVGATAVVRSLDSAHEAQALLDLALARSRASGRFSISVHRAIGEAASYPQSGKTYEREDALAALEDAGEALRFLRQLDAGEHHSATETIEHSRLHDARAALLADTRRAVTALLRAAEAGDRAAAERELAALDAVEIGIGQIEPTAAAHIDADFAEANSRLDALARSWGEGLSISFVVLMAVILASLLIAHWQIVLPVKRLAASAGAVAGGDLRQVVRVTNDDEIGELQRAFNRMIGSLTDRAEALRESEARYRDLFENANDMIQMIDSEGRFLYVNRAWRETLGYSEEQIATMTMFDVVHLQQHPHCAEMFRCLLTGQAIDRVETTFVTSDGRVIEVEGDINCRFEDGRPISTRGIFRDVTARKEVERLKREFISVVSHELRTPLTSIRGALGLVAGGITGALPPQAQSMIEIACSNSERLVRLINDILDIEKIEAGAMPFALRPLALRPLVEQALKANQAYAAGYGVWLELEDLAPGAWVSADADRLTQVLANLLSNAAKFSPRDTAVTVRLTRQAGRVRIAVVDRGPGIPLEFRERIFQKFAQADSSDTRQKGGTGLGLSICKAIVERLGGQIGFESEVGRSTTFIVDLPEWRESEPPPPCLAPRDECILNSVADSESCL